MSIMNEMMGEALRLVERQNPTETAAVPSIASPTTTGPTSTSTGGGGGGPTSSPLLFFVALGFGVVFTNLWIIVGVKYCFRYNARNRALRNGEEVDPIHMDNMPPHPRRRRKEKKLMTMDEVNERFPLTKYKTWVANRASAGLPTTGGVTAPPSRTGSVRDVEGVMPSSPVETKHSINTRPATAVSEVEVVPTPNNPPVGGLYSEQKKIDEEEKKNSTAQAQETTTPVNRQQTSNSVDDDEDEDDHIHTAVPPELLSNPGDSCAICIDTLEDDDDIRGLTCGHAFHAGCLDPWLTSRRACCPLCKADYYVPKPRPEGEAGESDRAARRREARMNMPQPPPSSWTGIRGNPRLLLPTRFGNAHLYDPRAYDNPEDRPGRRSRMRTATATETQNQPDANQPNPPEVTEAPTRSRWAPRVSNPFSAIRLPGRNRQTDPEQNAAQATPSQLEAGTATVR